MTLNSVNPPEPATTRGPEPIQVLFVLLPDTLLLDWAGPAEAFRLANQALARHGQPPAFALRFVGPQSEARSSVGAQIAAVEPLPNTLYGATWLQFERPLSCAPRFVARQNAKQTQAAGRGGRGSGWPGEIGRAHV